MKRAEARIRDYIASNISFVAKDFQLIKKEYYLRNAAGTRGFIDILAQDSLHNFVIIEIKRSNQIAKEALHEVFKYAGLLRQNLKIKESEIRICIISTEWDELLVPFSQFYRTTEYPLEGLKITLDTDGFPIRKEYVQPIDKPLERKIAFNHTLYLFKDEESMHEAIGIAKEAVEKVGLIDFVLLKVVCTSQKEWVIYPFGIYLAFQRYESAILRNIIVEHLDALDDLIDIEGEVETEQQIHYMEQKILGKVNNGFCHSLEVSSPDGFTSMVESQGWNVIEIIRSGLFADDPRLENNELLISEIKGFKGEGITCYRNHSPSKFKLRIKEIEKSSLAYLWNGENADNNWFNHVNFAFDQLKKQNAEYNLSVDVYNPKVGILATLFYILNYEKFGGEHPLDFLPTYFLRIDFEDQDKTTIIYEGRFKWSGIVLSLDDLIKRVFRNNGCSYPISLQYNINPTAELKVMSSLGFEYSTKVLFFRRGELKETKDVEIEDNIPRLSESKESLYLEDFLDSQFSFLQDLNEFYRKLVFVIS